MSKSNLFFGQPILSQLINLLDKHKIAQLSQEYKTDRYCKRFTTFQHLITVLYGVVSGCNSLRELCSGIVSYGDKISHCKFSYAPNKSTLSDANRKRDYTVFEAIYYDLVKQYLPDLSDSHKQLVIDKKTYSIDSTTISLFQPIFECVGRNPSNGKRKGGIKSHQKLDMQSGIPVKVYHSDAREHDSLFIQQEGVANESEVLVFDKAYNNYQLFDNWTTRGVFFVTRLKNNAKERFIKEFELHPATPNQVLKDSLIGLSYTDEKGEKREAKLRLVSYYSTEKDKAYYFLTNLFDEPAENIANLYKKRWQIELLFKKIKQNFPLQYFYGQNKNAIQIQIWITLTALLLITLMKKRVTKKWAFSNLVSLLQKHLFSYVKFVDFFNNIDSYAKNYVKTSKMQHLAVQTRMDFP